MNRQSMQGRVSMTMGDLQEVVFLYVSKWCWLFHAASQTSSVALCDLHPPLFLCVGDEENPIMPFASMNTSASVRRPSTRLFHAREVHNI